MNPDPVWPFSASELVLWIEVISIWTIASYAIASDIQGKDQKQGTGRLNGRTLLAIAIVGLSGSLLPPAGTSAFIRIALTALLMLVMTLNAFVRGRLAAPNLRHLAEWEIGTNLAVTFTSAATIGLGQIGGAAPGSVVRSGKFTAALCVAAAVVFVFRGGTYMVRSVLDKANAVPRRLPVGGQATQTSAPVADVHELNRGRAIGNLERLLMVMVIGLGSYEALGFLVAAKGLIRAREFEDRNFAEYFILGNLASVAVAFVAGTLLRVSVIYLWALP